jgi:hypothetical protein
MQTNPTALFQRLTIIDASRAHTHGLPSALTDQSDIQTIHSATAASLPPQALQLPTPKRKLH